MKIDVDDTQKIFHQAISMYNINDFPAIFRLTKNIKECTANTLCCMEIDDKFDLSKCYGILTNKEFDYFSNHPIVICPDLLFAEEGQIISISKSGHIRTLFKPSSHNNVLFITETCNNYCIMCPQPPKVTSNDDNIQRLKKIISAMDPLIQPETMGVTGGEPTMIGIHLIEILDFFQRKFPHTKLEMLTNGKLLSNPTFTKELADKISKNSLICIPLYSSIDYIHDYIVQSQGAFYQTLNGIFECHKNNLNIEIRIVLNKINISHLSLLASFITRNLMFVSHVAIMAMEFTGFAKLNFNDLVIDIADYSNEINSAVKTLHENGIFVSLYNIPLCITQNDIHPFCRQSISDFKNIYYSVCQQCSKLDECSGFFSSNQGKYVTSNKIKPFTTL